MGINRNIWEIGQLAKDKGGTISHAGSIRPSATMSNKIHFDMILVKMAEKL